MNIYVASSWRNLHQPAAVAALRAAGHEVYDFRRPLPGDEGFHWSEIDGGWKTWTVSQYAKALDHPLAARGFGSDMAALDAADLVVLVLPSGRSASWEYGHWCGRTGKQGIVHVPEAVEPELMYRGSLFTSTLLELLEAVKVWEKERGVWTVLPRARESSVDGLLDDLDALEPTPKLPFDVWSAIGRLVVQPAIELVIHDERGRVLLTRRKDQYWDAWHFPGGFQSPGESLQDTASRVAERELGISVAFHCVLHVEHWPSHPYVSTLSIFCECRPVGIERRTDGEFFDHVPEPMIPMQSRFLAAMLKGVRPPDPCPACGEARPASATDCPILKRMSLRSINREMYLAADYPESFRLWAAAQPRTAVCSHPCPLVCAVEHPGQEGR